MMMEFKMNSGKNKNAELLKGVAKKSLIILFPAAAASVFFPWPAPALAYQAVSLPLGIISGGLFGILNLRGLIIGVEGLVASEGATAKIVFLNMTRLFLLFVALFILMWLKIVNVFGMLFGFTVVFILILIEGLKVAKSK